jgi:hypothetical protein
MSGQRPSGNIHLTHTEPFLITGGGGGGKPENPSMDLIGSGTSPSVRADLVELRKAPVGLWGQTRAMMCENAGGPCEICSYFLVCVEVLHAYQIRPGNGAVLYVQLSVKVLHHRHSVSISNIESSISVALPSQSLDKTLSIGVVRTIWSGDLDALLLGCVRQPRLPKASMPNHANQNRTAFDLAGTLLEGAVAERARKFWRRRRSQ